MPNLTRPSAKTTQVMCSAFHHVARLGGDHHDGMAAAFIAARTFRENVETYGTAAYEAASAVMRKKNCALVKASSDGVDPKVDPCMVPL